MSPLDTGVDGRPWSVDIRKSWRLGGLWVCECFPYYTDGQSPRYPGFEVLKIWLHMYCPSAAHEIRYHDGKGSTLQVTFNDPEEAMLFRLNI